jgi:hypothetical protein
MAAIAEIPILTGRALDLLGEAIPAQDCRALRDLLQSLKPLFATFLCSDDEDLDEAFILASSKYVYPRLQLLVRLLSILKPDQVLRLVAATGEAASEMISQQGWRLGADLHYLQKAWDAYGEIGGVLTQNLTTLNQLTSLPYGLLMASTKMDFSLTGTALYLEGELPDANRPRLAYLCRAAESEATKVRDLLTGALFPSPEDSRKSQVLWRLFGSWSEDDRLERDLQSLYKSRLYSRLASF